MANSAFLLAASELLTLFLVSSMFIGMPVPTRLYAAFAQVRNWPPLAFVPDNSTMAVVQGQPATATLQPKESPDYQDINVGVKVESAPPNTSASIQPWAYPMFDISSNGDDDRKIVSDYKMSVYVNSDAQPGNYTLKIVGTGGAKDKATTEYVQLTNETLGTVHLVIQPASPGLSLGIGEPSYDRKELCINDDTYGGQQCLSFVSKEEFPVTITADKSALGNNTDITLSTPSSIPAGTWLKFVPSKFVLPDNATQDTVTLNGTIMLAGAVKPFVGFPQDTLAVNVQANSTDHVASSFLPIIPTGNVTILRSAGAIDLHGEITPNINGTNFNYYGAVFDPSDDNSGPLQVQLSVEGIADEDGGNVSAMPKWLKAEIPTPSFALNPYEPYYFVIKVATSMAPAGDHYLAIKESVQESGSPPQDFVRYAKIHVMEPVYFGGGPAIPLPPPSPPAAQHPALDNIDSYISKPLPLVLNQTSLPVEITVRNSNNFTLYDVQVTNFSSAAVTVELDSPEKIDKLAPGDTDIIHATLLATNQTKVVAGGPDGQNTAQMFWTITAGNETGSKMESAMFQRQMTVVVPEFRQSLGAIAMALSVLGAVVAAKYAGRLRRRK